MFVNDPKTQKERHRYEEEAGWCRPKFYSWSAINWSQCCDVIGQWSRWRTVSLAPPQSFGFLTALLSLPREVSSILNAKAKRTAPGRFASSIPVSFSPAELEILAEFRTTGTISERPFASSPDNIQLILLLERPRRVLSNRSPVRTPTSSENRIASHRVHRHEASISSVVQHRYLRVKPVPSNPSRGNSTITPLRRRHLLDDSIRHNGCCQATCLLSRPSKSVEISYSMVRTEPPVLEHIESNMPM